jgi:hypothetical protein
MHPDRNIARRMMFFFSATATTMDEIDGAARDGPHHRAA